MPILRHSNATANAPTTPNRIEQIRTNPNERVPEEARKNLKKAESPESTISSNTLEIVPQDFLSQPEKKFHRKPETVLPQPKPPDPDR